MCSEVDEVQFICLLHISPLLIYKALYGILQLLAMRQHISNLFKKQGCPKTLHICEELY